MSRRGIRDEDILDDEEDEDEDGDDFEVDFAAEEQAYKCLDCGEETSGRITKVAGTPTRVCTCCDSENLVAVD